MSKRTLSDEESNHFLDHILKFTCKPTDISDNSFIHDSKQQSTTTVHKNIAERPSIIPKQSISSLSPSPSKINNETTSKTTTSDSVEQEKDPIDPFVAPSPAKYRDKFASPCPHCFSTSSVCRHKKEQQLKLLIVGHNPSDHAWMSGNMYSHPSNRMWKLLTGTYAGKPGIIPSTLTISSQNLLPEQYKIGFVDINTTPNSHSDSLSLTELYNHRDQFYTRLQNHLLRVQRDWEDSTNHGDIHDYEPSLVMFAGKRQYQALFPSNERKNIQNGLQTHRPEGFPYQKSKIYVVPSSSGLVGLKKEVLFDSYNQVFEEYKKLFSSSCFTNKTTFY